MTRGTAEPVKLMDQRKGGKWTRKTWYFWLTRDLSQLSYVSLGPRFFVWEPRCDAGAAPEGGREERERLHLIVKATALAEASA